ncbi:MAG: ABC transporter permease [Chloroflexi bacterium RBG_13_68_17]|nr:MAG: ABC transporter permease [Chloroflexi bacterium RBG_13_68_17]
MTTAGTRPASRHKGLPFSIRLEPRLDQPKWLGPAVSAGAVLFAFGLGAIVLLLVGGNPLRAYGYMIRASFGSLGVLSDTITKATPLILVGLACAVAFRMKLWNIGAEGQFFAGAFAASAVVLTPLLPAETSPWLMIPAMALAGILGGAVWGFVPGLLKARLNVNEVISTLMMNYIAVAWNNFFIFAVWTEGGFQMSHMFPRTAWLPKLADFADRLPELRGLTTHLGLVFGLVAAVIVWWVLYRSKWGFEIRLIGDNPRAARYAGLNIVRNTVLVMMLSGGLAGLAGMSEIAGVVHRLQGAISPGYGFTGIIIAWLAKLNPLVVVPVSVLFGALILAGREIQPSGISKTIQGIVLVSLIASDLLMRYRIRIVRRGAEA